jgi:hypothetical protein
MPPDDFTSCVANIIFAEHPGWRAFASECPDHDDDSSCLLIELPTPPEADASGGLALSTHREELTVSFDAWHHHCQPFGEPEALDELCREVWQEAAGLIDDLTAERTVVHSWWFGPHWRGSSLESAESPGDFEHSSYWDRWRVRSWRGTFNKETVADPAANAVRRPCPKCATPDVTIIGQALYGTRLTWYRITRCPQCSTTMYEDGGHYPPPALHADLKAAQGIWIPVLTQPVSDSHVVADAVRKALLVGPTAARAYLRGEIDESLLGTPTDAAWGVARLADVGLKAVAQRLTDHRRHGGGE